MSKSNKRVSNNEINPEEFYRPLFDSAGEGILLADNKGVIMLANHRMSEMFGYTKKNELIGKNISILIPSRIKKKHEQHVENYFKKPKPRFMGKGMTLLGLNKNREKFPLEISLNYFQSDNRTYAIALITDITERNSAEKKVKELNESLEQKVKNRTEELLQSQKLHSTIAQNFPEGTINVFDKKFNYVFVEGEELYKLGVTSEKLVGSNYLKRLPKKIAKEVDSFFKYIFKGHSAKFELKLDENYYILDAVPLKNSLGEINNILVIEKNITTRKKNQQKVEKALEKERELNSLKSRFVSMASHEFRTPLSTILTSVSLIEKYNETNDKVKSEKHINRIKSSVHNLTNILNDFLSLDRLETGEINVDFEHCQLSELCDNAIENVSGLLKKGQTIITKYDSSAKDVYIDKQLFTNGLLNLLSNAAKYSKQNTSITLTTSFKSNHFSIIVKDEGIGIPINEQKHLFERFFRANNVTNLQGTGLGLNITKKYVELMNGDINFKSTLNKGTTFILTFPI